MNREAKLLNEIITSLINVSNVVESCRHRLSTVDKENFIIAQQHLVASIQHLKRGKHNVDAHLEKKRLQSKGI